MLQDLRFSAVRDILSFSIRKSFKKLAHNSGNFWSKAEHKNLLQNVNIYVKNSQKSNKNVLKKVFQKV